MTPRPECNEINSFLTESGKFVFVRSIDGKMRIRFFARANDDRVIDISISLKPIFAIARVESDKNV